jgi:uncharacterized protein involved in outer membrane biogenesis
MAGMRRLLLLVTAIVVVLGAMLLFVRQSLMHGELRSAVEARLSATLGAPVSIGRLGVSILPRVAVSGSDVRVGDARVQAPAVGIERIRILPRLRPLLAGDVVIEAVQIDGFVAAVLRDQDGRWHLPPVAPASTPAAGGGIVIEHVRLDGARLRIFDAAGSQEIHERGSIDAIDADVRTEAGVLRLAPITGRIGGAPISGEVRVSPRTTVLELAAASIADDDLPAFLHLLGSERPAFLRLLEPGSLSATIQVDKASSRLTGSGTLSAPVVGLDPLRLTGFAAPFAINGSDLVFDPATFALHEGAHTGAVRVDLSGRPPVWSADSRVTGLDAGQFLRALAGSDQRLDGTASLTGVLTGRVGEPLADTVRGRARVDVTGGVIRGFPLLTYVNRALRLAEASGDDTRFERLSATLVIASGVATTEDLVLTASHLRVTARGRIGVDRSLALTGVAALSPDRSAAAIASIRELTGLRNARGELEVPLTISGTLDAPSFALDLQSALKKGLADELRRRLLRIIR